MARSLLCMLVVIPLIIAQSSPLFISNYLPDQAPLARKLSTNTFAGLESYSGYITVNKTHNSNMFFWFFPALNGNTSAPLLLWLQGGPGFTSLFGMFGEIGPIYVAADGKSFVQRNTTWHQNYNMLYIDNPVGVGFSFTEDVKGFSTSEFEVGWNLYNAMTQFFQVFPDFSANDFYVTGESYAGKYVPSLAYRIHVQNQEKNAPFINLAGISIGDGALDPISQFTGFSELLFYLGLCDTLQQQVIKRYEDQMVEHIGSGEFVEAFRVFDELLNGDFYTHGTYVYNITGSTNYFNVINPVYPTNPYVALLNTQAVKDMLHVGTYGFPEYNATVEEHLIGDWMRPVRPILPTLLDNYKVMIYNGQLDLILGPALTEKFLQTLEWKGTEEYRSAKRGIWKVDNQVAGFVRSVKNFRQVIVLTAGHMVPSDQPLNAFDMITRFVDGIPFY